MQFIRGQPRQLASAKPVWGNRRIKPISRRATQEVYRLLGAGERFAVANPKRGKPAFAIERFHAGAILLSRYILLQLVLKQIPQLFANRGILGGLDRGRRLSFLRNCGR